MRKVICSMMVSLDGYVEGPNRELDWVVSEKHATRTNGHRRSEDYEC